MFYYIASNITQFAVQTFNVVTQTLNKVIPLDEYYNVAQELNNRYNITNNIIHYKQELNTVLTSTALVQIYNRFSLMESFLLLDGVVCSFYFLRDFLILKLSSRKLSKRAIMTYNEEIVDKYNSLYRLSTLDRYLFYLIIYFGYNTINYFYQENKYSYVLLLPLVFPSIQNGLLSIPWISNPLDKYIHNKDMFIRYSIAKMSVHFVEELHPQIEKIQNYHIFIIYRLLSVKFVWNIIHNCLFISLLNLLRSYETTYYYYKGIKMAYYYNKGYLYNIIPLGDAIYLANIIVKEKRWRELEKLEVVNAFFTLVLNKYDLSNNLSGSFLVNSQMILFQVFSLYSIVSVFKILAIYIPGLWICILLTGLGVYLTKLNIKNITTSLLVYFLIIFNINDLIITMVIVTHKIVYYWLEEIYFFIKNIQNVKKVIKMYETPSREVMVSKIRDEYIVC